MKAISITCLASQNANNRFSFPPHFWFDQHNNFAKKAGPMRYSYAHFAIEYSGNKQKKVTCFLLGVDGPP